MILTSILVSSAGIQVVNDLGVQVNFRWRECATTETFIAGASCPCLSIGTGTLDVFCPERWPAPSLMPVEVGGFFAYDSRISVDGDVSDYTLSLSGQLDSVPPLAPTLSTGGGDPHFTGFQGQKFDFNGYAGNVYNLVSDCAFQMNTE